MYTSCLEKQKQVKALFANCSTEEAKYEKIIELGRNKSPLESTFKIPENLVKGCQSTMYLRAFKENGALFFQADSDALISAGLAEILIRVYSGESPEIILKCPPAYLEELGINASLSPSRANGLYSIHLRMKQDALKHLVKKNS